MAIRTFKQYGEAYGGTPTSIVVLLDGIEIYSGPVTTLDEPITSISGEDSGNMLFSWTQDAGMTTPRNLEISVSGGTLLLAQTLSDRWTLTNVSGFVQVIYYQTIDSTTVTDPYTEVVIDGVPMTRSTTPPGQWQWLITDGGNFKAKFNYPPGINYPDWDASVQYPLHSFVVYQNMCYQSSSANPSTMGISPTEDRHAWFSLPVAPWVPGQFYTVDTRVSHNNINYRAVQNVPVDIDISNTNYWAP